MRDRLPCGHPRTNTCIAFLHYCCQANFNPKLCAPGSTATNLIRPCGCAGERPHVPEEECNTVTDTEAGYCGGTTDPGFVPAGTACPWVWCPGPPYDVFSFSYSFVYETPMPSSEPTGEPSPSPTSSMPSSEPTITSIVPGARMRQLAHVQTSRRVASTFSHTSIQVVLAVDKYLSIGCPFSLALVAY